MNTCIFCGELLAPLDQPLPADVVAFHQRDVDPNLSRPKDACPDLFARRRARAADRLIGAAS